MSDNGASPPTYGNSCSNTNLNAGAHDNACSYPDTNLNRSSHPNGHIDADNNGDFKFLSYGQCRGSTNDDVDTCVYRFR